MLLKNLDTTHGLVNGARGVVKDFIVCRDAGKVSRHARLPVVEFIVILGGVKTVETRIIDDDTWDIRQGER